MVQAQACPAGAVGCASGQFRTVARACDDLLGFRLDSGWIPDDDAEIKFRIWAIIGGLIDEEGHGAEVVLETNTDSTWPEAITVVANDTGRSQLRMAYGFDFGAKIGWDLDVIGSGERDIPIPGVGDLNKLRFDVTQPLPNLGFAGVDVRDEEMEVYGRFPGVEIVRIDVLGPLLGPITFGLSEIFIEGGFKFNAAGYGAASYQTNQIDIFEADGPITSPGVGVSVASTEPEGYGSAVDLHIRPVGEFECEVGLVLYPTLFIEISEFEYEWDPSPGRDGPLNLHIPFDAFEDTADFEEQISRVMLPDVSLDRDAIDLGMRPAGQPAQDSVVLTNNGEAALTGTLRSLTGAVQVAPASINLQPRQSQEIVISADPSQLSAGAGVVIETNDPDSPMLTVGVLGQAVAPVPGPGAGPGAMMGDPLAGSGGPGYFGQGGLQGGCSARSVGTSSAPALWVMGLVAAFVARRRRG